MPDLKLSDFLKEFPWNSEYTSKGKPVEYLFSINTTLSLTEIWKILSDTSTFNRLLKLPEIEFVESDGRKKGSYSLMGKKHIWYEVPWEWMYGKHISNERIYEKGMFYYSRAKYQIQPQDDGGYRILVYFGWIPKGSFARIVLKLYKSGFIKNFTKTFNSLSKAKTIKTEGIILDANTIEIKTDIQTKSNQSQTVEEYLERINTDADNETSKKIIAFAISAPEEKAGYIRSKVVAKELNLPHDDVLPAMLYLTRSGFFNISWEILCPNCRGSKDHLSHLWESPHGSVCDKCNINFKESGYSMLEIAFRINPEIRDVQEQLFCSAEPAKKPMIIMQKKMEAGESCGCSLPLEAGRYRLIRMDDTNHVNYFDIVNDLPSKDVMWFFEDNNKSIQSGPDSVIKFQNESDHPVYITMQRDEIDDDILRPAELFNFQEFRDLFPDERLADGLSIDVGIQNILFVDIVGSSEKFKQLGDTEAFALVRGFYGKVHEIVSKNNGVMVKTIGDEVMCAFSRGIDALKASFRMNSVFNSLYQSLS